MLQYGSGKGVSEAADDVGGFDEFSGGATDATVVADFVAESFAPDAYWSPSFFRHVRLPVQRCLFLDLHGETQRTKLRTANGRKL